MPNSTIAHYHIEEMSADADGTDGVLYTPNGQAPAAGRERCRVIPPFVRQFDTMESE
jgi:hypothetical protein